KTAEGSPAIRGRGRAPSGCAPRGDRVSPREARRGAGRPHRHGHRGARAAGPTVSGDEEGEAERRRSRNDLLRFVTAARGTGGRAGGCLAATARRLNEVTCSGCSSYCEPQSFNPTLVALAS